MLPMFNPADRSDYECSVYGITLRRFLEDAVSGKIILYIVTKQT